MLYQQLAWGEVKKQYVHYIVDCLTLKNSYANTKLHNFVETLSATETSRTLANAYRNW